MAVSKVKKAAPLSEQVYDAILADLKNGKYAPGERVTEKEIASGLQVSHTPVREALGQLGRNGILSTRKGGGFVVPSPSEKEISDIFAVRELLEPKAAKIAASEYTEKEIQELNKALDQERKHLTTSNPNKFALANLAFRQALFDNISNEALKKSISQFDNHLNMIRIHTLQNPDVRLLVIEWQAGILDAISAHDGVKAAKLTKGYLEAAQKALLDAFRAYTLDRLQTRLPRSMAVLAPRQPADPGTWDSTRL